MSFSPNLGRWLQQDPTGYAAGDSNLYRYVGNAPTRAMDPSGLASVPKSECPSTETRPPTLKEAGIEKLVAALDIKDLDTDFSKAREAFDDLEEKIRADKTGFLKAVLRQFRNKASPQQRWLIDHLLAGTAPPLRELPPER